MHRKMTHCCRAYQKANDLIFDQFFDSTKLEQSKGPTFCNVYLLSTDQLRKCKLSKFVYIFKYAWCDYFHLLFYLFYTQNFLWFQFLFRRILRSLLSIFRPFSQTLIDLRLFSRPSKFDEPTIKRLFNHLAIHLSGQKQTQPTAKIIFVIITVEIGADQNERKRGRNRSATHNSLICEPNCEKKNIYIIWWGGDTFDAINNFGRRASIHRLW